MKPSRLSRHLPLDLGSIKGQRVAVSERELKILAKDTEFERAHYIDTSYPNNPPIEVSVVFSGKDINNSIHRPERCLLAQGWNTTRSRTLVIKGALPDGSDLPVREIVCQRPVELNNGKKIEVLRLQYYTFFGHNAITQGHYRRTWEDIKDRVFKGYDQQWAYATFSVPVTQVYADQGLINQANAHDLEESGALLQAFIKRLVPSVVDQNISE